MELCCGALLGMGETDEQRVELLMQLRDVGPAEVPLNFLNPRPGTPLGDRPLVEPLEAIRWIALFRLALPSVILRYAGGREVTLRELQAMGMTSGINALIVGQLPHDAGPLARAGLPDARRPSHAGGRPVQGDLTRAALHRLRPAGRPSAAARCGRDLDPPRFCPTCGRRLTVYVTPAHFRAACRDHGPLVGTTCRCQIADSAI